LLLPGGEALPRECFFAAVSVNQKRIERRSGALLCPEKEDASRKKSGEIKLLAI